ncbi:MAG TPA: hypothetical protein VE152_05670 [Acidimicrobiales bacterium]|nr:hypothetical protein [Acidimicrobiales bacterium]
MAQWLTRGGVPGAFDGAAATTARRGTDGMVGLGPSAFPFTAASTVWKALIEQGRAA